MPETNRTDDWLRSTDKAHLADAAKAGSFGYDTAFDAALDLRPLGDRLADWDRRRADVRKE